MGGPKLLVYVRFVVAATFDFMTEEEKTFERPKNYIGNIVKPPPSVTF